MVSSVAKKWFAAYIVAKRDSAHERNSEGPCRRAYGALLRRRRPRCA
jgi:hypothetical protein